MAIGGNDGGCQNQNKQLEIKTLAHTSEPRYRPTNQPWIHHIAIQVWNTDTGINFDFQHAVRSIGLGAFRQGMNGVQYVATHN